MRCIAIAVNGNSLCVAGITNASMIGPQIGAAVSDEYPPSLHIAGMLDIGAERTAHVYWYENYRLGPGDTVRFEFADSLVPSSPIQIKPTDSPEYLEEQRKFEEFERSFIPDRVPMRRTWPNLAFDCILNGERMATARFVGNEEHILCTVHWDKWRPDRCRVFVRTFGDKSRPEATDATEWFRRNLALGDVFGVRLAAQPRSTGRADS